MTAKAESRLYDSLEEYPGGSASAVGGDRATTNSERGRVSSRLSGEDLPSKEPKEVVEPISDFTIANPDEWELNEIYKNVPELNLFENPVEVGRGAFSTVFVANPKTMKDRKVVLKKIKCTAHIENAVNELKYLMKLGGRNNVPELLCQVHHEGSVVLVMPYLKSNDFGVCIRDLRVDEIQNYFRRLFRALAHVHSFGIIHRDVKPGNFLFNRATGECLLIDFGLAQYEVGKGSPPESSSDTEDEAVDVPAKPKRMYTPLRELVMPQAKYDRASSPSSDDEPEYWGTSLRARLTKSAQNDENNGDAVLKMLHNLDEEEKERKRLEKLAASRKPIRRRDKHKLPSFEDFSRSHFASFEKHLPRNGGEKAMRAYLNRFSYAKPAASQNAHVYQKKSDAYLFLDGENCPCLGEGWICEICEEQAQMRAPRGGTPGFRAPEVLLKSLRQTTAIDVWSAGIILLAALSRQYPFFTACDDAESLVEIAGVFGTQSIVDLGSNYCNKVVTFDPVGHLPPLDLRGLSLTMRPVPDVSVAADDVPCDFCHVALRASDDPRCLCDPDWKRRRLQRAEGGRHSHHHHHLAKNKCREKTAKSCLEPVRSVHDVFPDSAYDLLARLLTVDPGSRLTAEEALNHPFLNDDA